VEARIRGSLDELWRRTQVPELHERWDLRFSSIRYLGSASENEPQRFRYATRLGLGVEVEGWGETLGTHAGDGSRSSALKFGSEDPKSIIRKGSGYWKYEETPEGLRFVTGYDYEVRWGAVGHLVDRIAFRPLIGWATAWSFDRLRLWIERDLDPARSARLALIHAFATAAVAFVWLWHGLVPKLLGPHPDELAMLVEAGVPVAHAARVARWVGAFEVLFGITLVVTSRQRWPWLVTIALMTVALAGVLLHEPARALAAFGPVTLTLAVLALSATGLLSLADLPSARRCRRSPR
jgi:hypothetical protein